MDTTATTTVAIWRDTLSASERLGISLRTLERMRMEGGGPKFAKAGRAVRYRDDWLDQWLEGRSFTSTSAAKAAGAP